MALFTDSRGQDLYEELHGRVDVQVTVQICSGAKIEHLLPYIITYLQNNQVEACYVLAGINDCIKVNSKDHIEVENRDIDTLVAAVEKAYCQLIEDIHDQFPNVPVVLCCLYGLHFATFNKVESESDDQLLLNEAIQKINIKIIHINHTKQLVTPRIHDAINKRKKKKGKICRYDLLKDGWHPAKHLQAHIAYILARFISRNRRHNYTFLEESAQETYFETENFQKKPSQANNLQTKTSKKGISKEATCQKDTIQEGTFPNDTIQKGTFQKDTIQKGTFQKGTFQKDTIQKGTFQKDTFQKGTFQNNTFQKGTFQKGTFQKGTFQNNTFQKGTFQKGTFQKGTFQNNNFQKGTFQNNNCQKGTFQNNFQKGTFQNNNCQKGTFQNDTFQKGTFQKDIIEKDTPQKDTFQGDTLLCQIPVLITPKVENEF